MPRVRDADQKKGSGVGWATIIISWTALLLALGARYALRTENTAQGVAILRFLATLEEDEAVRGPDDWAQFFVPTALKLAAPSLWVRQRVLKYINDSTPGAYEALMGRTRYFDSQLAALLGAHEDIQQFVVLGAGYDSRSLRFYPELTQRTHPVLRIEADLPDTQAAKQVRVAAAAAALAHSADPHPFANIAAESLHFAPTNFNSDDLLQALKGAAYDPSRRTVFLWEGVAAYLQPAAVNATLAFVRRHARAGSFLLFDFSPIPEPLMELARNDPAKLERLRRESPSELVQYMSSCYGMAETFAKIAALGEPAGFGIPTELMSAYLADHGLRVVEHVTPEELQRRYLTRSDGSQFGRIACYEHVVTAETLPLSA